MTKNKAVKFRCRICKHPAALIRNEQCFKCYIRMERRGIRLAIAAMEEPAFQNQVPAITTIRNSIVDARRLFGRVQ